MKYTWDITNKATYNNRYGRYKFKKEYQFILSQFKNVVNMLDVAGGSGRFAIPLSTHCNNITVIDINSEALELLMSRNASIKVIKGDFMTVHIDNKFSFLLCIEALNYFSDYDSFFEKINSLLDENGSFVFLAVNPSSWRFLARKLNKNREDYGELGIEEIKCSLQRNKLEIKKIKGFNWIPLPLTMSNSFLISVFAILEKIFFLENWLTQSPWLLISVVKNNSDVFNK
ncbi:methyltransferase domain-containing protein [Spirosoma fluviale]|uniref:Methyltransferase domain-containing protein n=1 Tax=Spirosoma fluviale TaxID=1597977 RepID=A0A286FDJ0_9BACT|nr:class I SAM-dependent methyltransferase [Spirosoma fluviale]SOD81270.1 Methyltransferase domain-containing protein [Spirosoma fluviale]